jgi:N-carbamoylputrescine amidase
MKCDPKREPNLQRAIQAIHRAADQQAQIVCLPELFLSPYFCNTHDLSLFDLAETIPGPTTETLSQVARERNVVVVASLFERMEPGMFFNTTAVIDANGQYLGKYRKMHIPHDPLYFEKYYFRPGDLGFKVFSTQYAKVGVLICWDQWFPEGARATALLGAEVLLYPTAIGWHPKEKAEFGASQYDAWKTAQRAHAIANGLFVGSVNRIGFEPSPMGEGLEFWGGSFIADPFGVLLSQASHDQEEILVARCQRDRMEDVRRNWPFFRDRRIEAYGGLVRPVGE